MENPIHLEIFKHLLVSVPEEMGVRLQRAAFSPNIKERCDFSCAVFNVQGELVAQAAHIPVHLGAMPLSVEACLRDLTFAPGDVAMVNDPYRGGTHLPDITLVSPVYVGVEGQDQLLGFVAARAHHADVGGMSPGSMPLSQELYQEGVIIPPIKLVSAGNINQEVWSLFLANVRTPEERAGDLRAQMAANRIGIFRLQELVGRYGFAQTEHFMKALLAYSERMMRQLIQDLPDGTYRFQDCLDDDGVQESPIEIVVAITINRDEAIIDFSGTSCQCKGSINAVYAITLSAVSYVFRCLIGEDIPTNSGGMKPIHLKVPEGCVVNAHFPAAVAGGNVETCQRIVDVVLGAMAQVCPGRIPAASQGTMNNVAMGHGGQDGRKAYAYYETIGGGMGAGPENHGADAIHSHMTNTMNTPVEALEYAYPFRVITYAVRRGSGGKGRKQGGNGILRRIEFLQETHLTILSDRRSHGPYGLAGGEPGQPGRNVLLQENQSLLLPSKVSVEVQAGDILTIETPGGGGFGVLMPESPSN